MWSSNQFQSMGFCTYYTHEGYSGRAYFFWWHNFTIYKWWPCCRCFDACHFEEFMELTAVTKEQLDLLCRHDQVSSSVTSPIVALQKYLSSGEIKRMTEFGQSTIQKDGYRVQMWPTYTSERTTRELTVYHSKQTYTSIIVHNLKGCTRMEHHTITSTTMRLHIYVRMACIRPNRH